MAAGGAPMLLTFPVCLAARGAYRSHAERAVGVGYWHPRPNAALLRRHPPSQKPLVRLCLFSPEGA